jgi:hypothetical protein
VAEDLRGFVIDHLGEPDAVLIVDESGDLKEGTDTVGVQRQYIGTAGRIENAQVAVYLAYDSRGGHALIDRELYLPRSWAEGPDRHAAAGVPEQVEFATTPTLVSARCRNVTTRVPRLTACRSRRRAARAQPCRVAAGWWGGRSGWLIPQRIAGLMGGGVSATPSPPMRRPCSDHHLRDLPARRGCTSLRDGAVVVDCGPGRIAARPVRLNSRSPAHLQIARSAGGSSVALMAVEAMQHAFDVPPAARAR